MLKSFPCASQGVDFGLWTKENLGPIKLKRNMLQQFENFKIYKDLYKKQLNSLWLDGKSQILLTLAALAIITFATVLFQFLLKLF